MGDVFRGASVFEWNLAWLFSTCFGRWAVVIVRFGLAQKGLWNLAGEKRVQERGVMPKEECDVIREYNAVHEGNFPSSWQSEDLVEKRKE